MEACRWLLIPCTRDCSNSHADMWHTYKPRKRLTGANGRLARDYGCFSRSGSLNHNDKCELVTRTQAEIDWEGRLESTHVHYAGAEVDLDESEYYCYN